MIYWKRMRKSRLLYSHGILPAISVITFLGFLDTHLLIPVIALYASGLGASAWSIGLIVGLYSITNTPANIFSGRLIDKIGFKVPLIAGMAGDALSMFLYSLCQTPFHLALVRVLHGTSGGLVGPATMSVISNYSNETQKGRTMAFYGMSIATATLFGYGLSGVIVSRLGYEALFLFGAGLLTIGVILSFLLPGSRQKSITTAQAPASNSYRRRRNLILRKNLRVSYSSIFAQYFTFGGVVTLLPLHVKNLGMEAFHVGILLTTFTVMFIILQLPSGSISDKIGRRLPILTGISLGIVSLALLPLMKTFPLLIAVMALYGVAYGMLFPSISVLIPDNTTPEERGMATGIFHALLTTGVAAGALVAGWMGGMTGIESGFFVASGIMALALVFALMTLKQS